MQILLKKMSLVNFKGIRSAEFDFNPTVNTVLGDNATGKTTIMNALFPLIKDEAALEKILIDYSEMFWKKHDEMMAKKFGFEKLERYDADFFTSWQKLMEEISTDYTLFFSLLESLEEGSNIIEHFKNSFYQNLNKDQETLVIEFVENYRQRLYYNQISKEERCGDCSRPFLQRFSDAFYLGQQRCFLRNKT